MGRTGRRTWLGLWSGPARDNVLCRLGRGHHQIAPATHSQAGRDSCDRRLSDLIGELSTRSEVFRVRWAPHNVRHHNAGLKRFDHPVVGALELNYDALPLPADPALTLVTHTAEAGSRAQETLGLLGNWLQHPSRNGRATDRRDATDRTDVPCGSHAGPVGDNELAHRRSERLRRPGSRTRNRSPALQAALAFIENRRRRRLPRERHYSLAPGFRGRAVRVIARHDVQMRPGDRAPNAWRIPSGADPSGATRAPRIRNPENHNSTSIKRPRQLVAASSCASHSSWAATRGTLARASGSLRRHAETHPAPPPPDSRRRRPSSTRSRRAHDAQRAKRTRSDRRPRCMTRPDRSDWLRRPRGPVARALVRYRGRDRLRTQLATKLRDCA